MSTRLADLTQFRNWWLNNGNPVIKEYRLTFPFTVESHLFAGQTGCESLPLAATVPTDGKMVMLPAFWDPAPMTLKRAVAVLNERKYRGMSWALTDNDSVGGFQEPHVRDYGLTDFEAIAIAEKLEREAK